MSDNNKDTTNTINRVQEIIDNLSSEEVLELFRQLRFDYLQVLELFKEHYQMLSQIELLSINGVIDSSKYKQGGRAIESFMKIKELLQAYQQHIKTTEEQIKDKDPLFDKLDMQLGQLKGLVQNLRDNQPISDN